MINPFFTPIFLFFFIFFCYLGIIVFLDNTTIHTTNGVYKAVSIQQWQTLTKFPTDNGGYLYLPLMALLTSCIPDSWVSFYGSIGDFSIWRKMAVIHAAFGAGSSVLVYFIGHKITESVFWSVGVSLIHSFFSYILINSIGSEDIMPGYFFFLLSFLFLLLTLTSEKKRIFLGLSTVSLVGVVLLHWTLFPPLVASYGILAIYVIYKERSYLRLLGEQALLFCSLVFLFSVAANFLGYFLLGSSKNINFWGLLLPGKASGSWVGFFGQKFECLYIGISSFPFSINNTNVLPSLFSEQLKMLLGIGFLIATVSFLLYIFFKEKRLDRKALPIFGLSLFIFGEIQNLYGSPQDPQFQVQPMFILTVSMIFLFFSDYISLAFKKLVLVSLFMVMLIFDYFNLTAHRGYDSQSIEAAKEFMDTFPEDHYKLSHVSYEISPLLMIMRYKGDWSQYLSQVIVFNTPLTNNKTSVKEVISFAENGIDKAFSEGKKIITKSPWVYPDYIYSLEQQKLSKEDCEKLTRALLSKYKVRKIHKLLWGDFAEIERR